MAILDASIRVALHFTPSLLSPPAGESRSGASLESF